MTLTSPFIDLSFSFYFSVQIDWAQIPLEERKRLRREAARHAKKKETKGIGNEAAEVKRLRRLKALNDGPDIADATGAHRGKPKRRDRSGERAAY